jgi:predicted signal transduction protein with EAL and GGDEF domain
LSAKNSVTLAKDITLRFRVGVCHAFGGTKGTAMEMVDNALSACKLAEEKANAPYVVYDVKINEEIAKNEKIESMMEDGLKNGDFKLFLQPKYNIKADRIDSAEALVRWFDRERADYIFPGEFIGLFETNGFIVKLDHYVYLEVLKYFKSAVERGEKIVPISVNVSRVTATAPDFLDFYIEINNKKIDLEIDGKQHNYPDRKESDKQRDKILKNAGYIVYRIKWNEINSEDGKIKMKSKIDKFLDFINNL